MMSMWSVLAQILVLFLGSFQSRSTDVGPKADTVDLCTVLANLEKYKDREVRMRGEWVQTEHGMFLRARCNSSIQTDNHQWPSAVWLQLPWLETEPQVDFTIDRAVLEKAQADAGRLLTLNAATPVYATFMGRLQTRNRLEVTAVGRSDRVVGNGYGHLSAYPAQLVIRSVGQVSARK